MNASGDLIGDSVWDLEAADWAGLPGCALRTGGFSVEELRWAGAREVYDSLTDMRTYLDEVVGAARARPGSGSASG
jgi:phosphoglycolate phosphatase-like HAD superfamily hydrolase